MPKLLFLTCWYPTASDPSAGVFIKEHAKAAYLAGAEVTVLHYHIKKSRQLFHTSLYVEKLEGIDTIVLSLESVFWKFFYQMPFLLWQIIKYKLSRHELSELRNVEVIHSHVIFPAGMLGYKLSRRLGVPHVISEHWTKTEEFFRQNIYSGWGKRAYKSAAVVLPVSDQLSSIIESMCKPLQRIKVIPNVINTEVFNFKAKPAQGKVIFVAVALWQQKKNFIKRPDLIIEALGRIQCMNIIDFELIMVGGGNLVGKLQNKCRELSINASFRGFLTKHEIAGIMQQSNYLLHASEFETFGIVVYEALSTGTPVIASDLSVFRPVIHKNNGVLCLNSVDSFTKGILQAMKTNYNHRLIAEDVKDKYSYKSVGEAIIAEYKNLLSQ
jgi:L-malate glycosyltransferase